VRLIVLEVCAGIVALLFIVMLVATASHRARLRAGGEYPASALAEYGWAVVPWIMVAAAALPAVRLIVATP
jgi:heme/copper-type cytochrome/quinol oxidase subunit 2